MLPTSSSTSASEAATSEASEASSKSAGSPQGPSPLKVTASARPGSRVALEVAIPGARSQASYEAAVEKLSRSIKLPGFRKGKVPRAVLVQQLGPLRIRATALEDLVDSVFRDALQQAEIAAIGQPALDGGFEALLERFEPGQEQVAHAHAGSDKVYFVIEGAADVRIGDEIRRLGPGEAAHAGPGLAHGIANPGPGRLTALVFMAPKP